MAFKTAARKGIWWTLTAGATLSIGFLAFSGMFLFSSSFIWCGGAFILAAAYESQVNGEGIAGALERMFDPNHLRLGIVEKYLDEILEQKDFALKDNLFFKDYKAQKEHIEKLEDHIADLKKLKATHLWGIERTRRKEIDALIKAKKAELKEEKKRLLDMRMCFLENLTPPANEDRKKLTPIDLAARELAAQRSTDSNSRYLNVIEKYLNEILEQRNFALQNNLFFRNYKTQKDEVTRLERVIADLEKSKAAHLRLIEGARRDELSLLIREKEAELNEAKERLRKMQLCFLENLTPSADEDLRKLTAIDLAARELGAQRKDALLKEMNYKAQSVQESMLEEMKYKSRLIKASWILAIGAGVSSGLATLSAIKLGIAGFAFLSAIPGGAIIALCAVAAIGYTLLVYQSMSEMIQKYSSRAKSFFRRRVNEAGEPESRFKHVLRCTGAVLAIGLGIFATFATAGTWWLAAKHGASILGAVETVASTLRTISVSLMVVPTFIFNAHNSVESIDNISKSDYKKLFVDAGTAVKKAFDEENIVRFFNPFRIAERIISIASKSLLLVAHTLSIGISSDGAEGVPAKVSAPLSGGTELLTDLNFMPNEKSDSHESFFLKVLFAPIVVAVGVLSFFAAGWDYIFSSPRDLKKSFKKMYCQTPDEEPPVAPAAPDVSKHWYKHELVQSSRQVISRLKNKSPTKVAAGEAIIQDVIESKDGDLSRPLLQARAEPLRENRYSYWNKPVTQSQEHLDHAMDTYFRHQAMPA